MPSSESPTPQPVDAAAQAEILAQRPNLDTCPRCRRSYVQLFGLSPDHHWPVDAGKVIGHYCGLCCSFISGHGPTPQISAEVTAAVAITQSDDAAGVGSSPAGEKRRSDFQCKKCGGTEYWVSYVPDGLPPTVAMCNACSPLDPEDLMPEQEANPYFTPEPVPESVREPADPSQPWREVWGRDADADPEPFEPTGEGPLTDPLLYEMLQARCNGDCPTPGDCARCNAALNAELAADPALAASLAGWQRTSGPGPVPASLGWRRLDAYAQADFLGWAEDQLADRLAIVEQEYQSHIYGFQGDPLEHLIKEQLDGLFYSWQELRRRNAERNAIDDRGLLILWRLYCDAAGVAQSTADDRNRIDTFVAWLDDHCADAYNANLPALREAWQRFIIGNREFTVAS